ncbi:Ribose ABC transport system, ATP-binding protein RbsA (TC 3.A.1.2.1) [Microbacterium esteraromaticum]|uniref:Ribose ABC transport system, ATP-binding protein RbsA (TC 3.A.1.2.1) n=1 Tax=Microbacterium esteraromaticum TaxID=57043 RepID=A0A1R4K741_9MICO|nr:Ribose ABC transport system, ATP-binding protein RbsA (TC 3.A.1.2.1) [Microbacterium esteraromaticum]
MSDPILRVQGISKGFPGVQALKDVDLEVRAGEVLVLVGENGAGKSTLMKILSGIYTRDEGTITFEGEPVELTSPLQAQQLGITIIHQELNMMPDLTVAQNIFIGREPDGRALPLGARPEPADLRSAHAFEDQTRPTQARRRPDCRRAADG